MDKIAYTIPGFFGMLFLSLPHASVDVPLVVSPAVVIDARIDSLEWKDASVQRLSDGTTIRLQHDGKYLYIGIAAARSGFGSVCASQGNAVRVFHASAALGNVTYIRYGDVWTTGDTAFTYGMRNSELSRRAQEERLAFLTQHQWLASTTRMSSEVHEMQISLELLDRAPRLALGYFVIGAENSWSILPWPSTMPPSDGCANSDLVRGYVPSRLGFATREWAELNLGR